MWEVGDRNYVPGPAPTYGGSFVAGVSAGGAGATQTFSAAAAGANHAVLVLVTNKFINGSAWTGVSITATGWTFVQIGSITSEPSVGLANSALFVAISPNTTTRTFTVTWTGGSCEAGHNAYQIGDEFSGTNLAGGASTVTAYSVVCGSSGTSITTTVTPTRNNEMLWAGTLCAGNPSAGSGYTQGSIDSANDISEYKTLNGGVGASQTVNMTQSPGGYWMLGAAAISGVK